MNLDSGDPESLVNNVPKYFFMGLLPAATNPESLKLMPWRNKAATDRLCGLPSVKCLLFCTVAAIVEDVPQLTVQYLFARRALGPLPWQLELSMAFSVWSLFSRVLMRLFIGCIDASRVSDAPDNKV